MDREQLLNNLEISTRTALLGFQAGLWTALPCIVESVNFEQMTVSAQPAVQGFELNQQGEKKFINYPILEDVPIVFPSGGNFSITFPIKKGDEVLVIFSARCIDFWWESGKIQNSIESRMNDLSDCFAIPCLKSLPNVIPNIAENAVQIRSNSGSSYVQIGEDDKITIVSEAGVFVEGDLNVSGSINSDGEITAGSIPLSTHKHLGVTPGSGTSGEPTI